MWFLLITLVFAACLAPAVINGTPPIFPDSLGYLGNAQSLRPTHMRPFGYGAWLRVSGAMLSLWLPAMAQAALSAWLALRLVALEARSWPERQRLGLVVLAVLLLVLGPMPWLAAWLMPDLFTGLIALALLIIALHWAELPVWERAALTGFLVCAASLHLTHPPMLVGIALGCGALALLDRRVRASARRVAINALLAAAIGWGALVAANFVTYKQPTASLGGPVFFFARLVEDGDVPAILRPRCEAGAPWAICGKLDRLRGMGADEFLWRDWSPLRDLGWGPGFYREAAELNPILLREMWPQWLAGAARRTLAQSLTFGLGDGFDDEGPRMVVEEKSEFDLPWAVPQLTASRQFDNGLLPFMPRGVSNALCTVGLLGVAGLTAWGALRRRPALWWPGGLFVMLWLGNAALISAVGVVHARYGTRLVWVAPLLALALALRAAGAGEAAPAAVRIRRD